MDISAIKQVTQKVAVIHPGNGTETGLVVEVTSAESDPVKRVRRRQIDKALRSRSRKTSASEMEENALEVVAATVVGWEWKGDAGWGGKKLEFTPENVNTVLTVPWIRIQIEEVINDEAGFFTN